MNILDKNYRHELKFIINSKDIELLKKKLSMFMKLDNHYDNDYLIRSLYFDDIYNTNYYDKLDGTSEREKYRIRYYNYNKNYISLELKGKNNNLTYKERCPITVDEYNYLIDKKYDKINIENRLLLEKFIFELKNKNLVPSVIVEYKRLAYIYELEDIRITIDSDIKSGRFNYNMFDKNIFMDKVLDTNEVILEVKYNNVLPTFINDIIKSTKMTNISVSKYVLCVEKKGL